MSSVPITPLVPPPPVAPDDLSRAHLFVLVTTYLLEVLGRLHAVLASFVRRTHWTFSVLLILLAISLIFFALTQPRRRVPRAHTA